jgi:peptidyl-prolyl cis-trans isomerase A (cyclophilin A)
MDMRSLAFAVLIALTVVACSKREETDDPPRKARPPVNVEIDTTMGKIVVELNPSKAPITVQNFLSYVDAKHYDGTIFHRVIDGFMIQGGGFEPGLRQKVTRPGIFLESNNGLHNERGTIAMARTSIPDSATDQFFINVVDNSSKLDPDPRTGNQGYAVFGKVIEGMDVVDQIRKVETGSRFPHENVPVKDVVIKSIRRQ